MKRKPQTSPDNATTPTDRLENDPILEAFLARLEPELRKLGISRSALAARIGVTRNALSQFFLRKRRPSLDILIKIANQLTVSIDYLIGRANQSEIVALIGQDRIIELVNGFAELTSEEQKSVLNYISAMRQAHLYGDSQTGRSKD